MASRRFISPVTAVEFTPVFFTPPYLGQLRRIQGVQLQSLTNIASGSLTIQHLIQGLLFGAGSGYNNALAVGGFQFTQEVIWYPGDAISCTPGLLPPSPTNAATLGGNASNTNTTTLVMNVSAAVSVGSLVIVEAGCSGADLTSITDSKGNVYSLVTKGSNGTQRSGIFSGILTTALTNTDTITLTTPTGLFPRYVAAVTAGNVNNAPYATNNTSGGVAGSISIATSAIVSNGDLVVATAMSPSGSLQNPAGWTEVFRSNTNPNSESSLFPQGMNAAVTYTPTGSAGAGWAAAIAAFPVTQFQAAQAQVSLFGVEQDG